MVVSVGAATRFSNEDLRQLRGELREYLEAAVEMMEEECIMYHIVVCEL
jgi:hypothetical protein